LQEVVVVKVADLFFQLPVNPLPFCLPRSQVSETATDIQ
jgi:hypothetical protein